MYDSIDAANFHKITKPMNLCGEIARLYRCLRKTTSLRDKHFPSLSMQIPFFGPRMIELSTFLIRYTAREIILRACGAMASAASAMRPQLSGKERKKN